MRRRVRNIDNGERRQPTPAELERLEKTKASAERRMSSIDRLSSEGRALVHRWGQRALDRMTLLKMTPAEAEEDLLRKFPDENPVRT